MVAGSGTDASPDPGSAVARRPEDRGRTEIADRVLQRIAARAAAEVDLASGQARRVLGLPLPRGGGRSLPSAAVQVDGSMAIVRLRLAVTYPAPVRQVTRRVREHVTARMGELTGLQVRQVDIEVTGLTVAPAERRRLA